MLPTKTYISLKTKPCNGNRLIFHLALHIWSKHPCFSAVDISGRRHRRVDNPQLLLPGACGQVSSLDSLGSVSATISLMLNTHVET